MRSRSFFVAALITFCFLSSTLMHPPTLCPRTCPSIRFIECSPSRSQSTNFPLADLIALSIRVDGIFTTFAFSSTCAPASENIFLALSLRTVTPTSSRSLLDVSSIFLMSILDNGSKRIFFSPLSCSAHNQQPHFLIMPHYALRLLRHKTHRFYPNH